MITKDEKLTGRVRHRTGLERLGLFSGRQIVIVQVEETYSSWAPGLGRWTRYSRWRDMRITDLPLPLISAEPLPPPEDVQ